MSTVAPAARAILSQATARAPDRNRASDGLKGDERHEDTSSLSWHLARRPGRTGSGPKTPDGTIYVRDPNGVVYAADLTNDPAHGVDAHAFVRQAVARRDPRVMEAISLGRIWTKARASEGWRIYHGENPHDKHAHVTVDPRYAGDTSPWWPQANEEDQEMLYQETGSSAIYQILGDGKVHVSRAAWDAMGNPRPKKVPRGALASLPKITLPKSS